MHLSSRLINNAIFNLAGRLWPILLGLVTTPYIVSRLGIEPYGVLVLVSVTLGYMIFLDLGLNTSLIKYLAEYYALKDYETIRKYIGTSLIIYVAIGTLGCLILIQITKPLVSFIPQITPDLQPVAQFAFYIAAIGFFITLVSSVFQAVISGLQRYDLLNSVSLTIGTVRTVGTVLILWQGYWLKEVVVFHLLVSVGDLAANFFLANKLIPQLLSNVVFIPDIARKLANFGFMALISRISGLLLFQFDRTYIGLTLGAALVTYYAIADNLGRQMHGFVQSITLAVFPLASELKTTNQIQLLRRLYLRGLRWSVILAAGMVAIAGALSFKFLYFWMGPEFANISTNILRLLLIAYGVAALTTVPYTLLDGMGLPQYNAFFAVINAGINIVGCIILIPRMGLVGAAWANVLFIFSVPLYLNFVEKKILEINSSGDLFNTYLRSFLVAGVTFLFIYLIQFHWVNNLIELSILAGVGIIAYSAFCWLLNVVEKQDKVFIYQYLNRLWLQGKFFLRHFTP